MNLTFKVARRRLISWHRPIHIEALILCGAAGGENSWAKVIRVLKNKNKGFTWCSGTITFIKHNIMSAMFTSSLRSCSESQRLVQVRGCSPWEAGKLGLFCSVEKKENSSTLHRKRLRFTELCIRKFELHLLFDALFKTQIRSKGVCKTQAKSWESDEN